MFIPPFMAGWFPSGPLTGPPPDDTPAEVEQAIAETLAPPAKPDPRPDVPTLADALAVLRKEVRDTVALQPRKATAPPLIVIASYAELAVILDHVEQEHAR